MTTVTFTSSGSWAAAAAVVDCQAWGESGNAANGVNGSHSGGAGGGGEFAEETTLAVSGTINFTIGTGGTGTATSFPGTSVTVTAHAGASASTVNGVVGGTGSSNSIHNDGGHGGNGSSGSNKGGGGGGGSGGSGSAGGPGGTGTTVGGSAGSAGTGTSPGAPGSAGGGPTTAGGNGNVPGGAPGGGGNNGNRSGGNAVSGQVTLTYNSAVSGTATLSGVGTLTAQGGPAGTAALSGVGTLTAARAGAGVASLSGAGSLTANASLVTKATLAGVGTLTALGSAPQPAAVNQWAGGYGQGTTFDSITSALQSAVVPLTPAFSVGGGSGTPTAGNWLFCIASWTQDPSIAEVHVGTGDDIHSYWREYPASQASGLTRTAIAYTPNIARAVGNVYVAPDMEIAACNVLVVEISGLGPWDTVTGTVTNYAAAATSLSLALGAPPQAAFWIGATGGDNIASGQAFLPGGWTGLVTQTQTNGVNALADNILTAAILPNSASSHTVSGTSSTPENMSGFMLAVEVAAASPIPAAQNPNWPYLLFEAGFGAGFNTPDSEITWTDLTSRLWNWDETTGIQYQLGELQATHLTAQLDDFDGALIPPPSGTAWTFTASGTPLTGGYFIVTTAQAASITAQDGFTDTSNPGKFFTVTNVGAPFAGFCNITFTPAAATVMSSPDVVTQVNPVPGTPLRIRAALGTIGGTVVNRWYVVQRNTAEWGEAIDDQLRRYADITGTDLWAAMSASPPTFYRAEVTEDAPYAWWPLDDQPGNAGVLPVQMLNAALGNTNTLNVALSPNGGTAQPVFNTAGNNVTVSSTAIPPSIATYTAGASSGWMFGDPIGSPSSFSTGNPVSAQPGSAAWQQAGHAGNSGSYGWYLICNDAAFPPLSGGVTVEGWFNYQYFGSTQGLQPSGQAGFAARCQQPYAPLTLMELATAGNPVAILQLNISGHLSLITYNGSTPTSHSIYSSSDLRMDSWFMVTMTLTASTWTVYVNGSATAQVSGSGAGMTSAWTYLILNADFGSGGGTSPAGIAHGGNVQISHVAVYPYILPYYRVMDHYWAAVTAFGQIPAPTGVAAAWTGPFNPLNGTATFAPDGSVNNGSYNTTTVAASAVATANIATFTSGPSARGTATAYGGGATSDFYLWVGFTGLAASFQVYTNNSLGSETGASVTMGGGDSYTSGFGGGGSGAGVAHTGGGSGASPPAAGSSIGDTVGERIERLMSGGNVTSPSRCIDPAPLLVQAPGSTGGGTQAGSAIQAIQQSDDGMLYVDNVNNLTYWARDHLAGQYSSPVWSIGPTTTVPGRIPYYKEIRWVTDPQKIFNVITVTPLSPTGAALPLITPANATAANASQVQDGAQPLQIVSYLQSLSEMQLQANWLLSVFGVPQRRAENVMVDASAYPAAWPLVLGINVGDLVTLEDWQIGGGGPVYTMRVTELKRRIDFGTHNQTITGHVELTLDLEPVTYWS